MTKPRSSSNFFLQIHKSLVLRNLCYICAPNALTLNEIWKDVSGYEGFYQVSNLGRVRSLDRSIKQFYGHRNIAGNIIKGHPNHQGYLLVNFCVKQKNKRHQVHRLVAKAFIPNPDSKPNVNHIDGNNQNNALSNLEWCTQKENIAHSFKIGRSKMIGKTHYRARLTPDNVRDIRISNLKAQVLAEAFGVRPITVYAIRQNRIWKSII